MSKQLVFIDDSGDPGFKSVSSDNFVMAAALFIDSKNAESVMREIGSYRKELGWRYNHEFKFTKNPKNIVIELLKRVNQYDFRVYAVYIDKDDFRKITPGMVPFFDKERLYNWMIKELLQEMPIKTAKITIDGRSSKQNMRNTKTYLRREISGDGVKVDIKFEDSARADLLQLADIIAGSVNRSLQTNKTDTKKYISMLGSKIAKIRKIDFR